MKKVNLFLIFSFVFLISCDQSGCILHSDFSNNTRSNNVRKTEKKVLANNEKWINSGITVSTGDSIQMITNGTINTCMNPPSISNSAQTVTSSTGESVNYGNYQTILSSKYIINGVNYYWTVNSITSGQPYKVYKGDRIFVQLNPPNSNIDASGNKWSTWNGTGKNQPTPNSWNSFCSSASVVLPPACWYTYGQLLRANFLDITDQVPNNSIPNYNNNSISLDPSSQENINKTSSYNSSKNKTLNIRSAGDLIADNVNKTIDFNAPKSGFLGFGVSDADNPTDPRNLYYQDNMGGYTIDVTIYGCPSYNGEKNDALYTEQNIVQGNLLAVVSQGRPGLDSSDGTLDLNGNSNQTLIHINDNEEESITMNGDIWLKVKDSIYTDNIGAYDVNITAKVSYSNNVFSSTVASLANIVETNLVDSSIQIVKNIMKQQGYIKILRLMLVLYIILYALSFTIGLVEISQMDLVTRIFKMSIIFAFMSDNSWEFFYENFFRLFGVVDKTLDLKNGFQGEGAIYYLIDIMTGGDGSQKNPFLFVDVAMQAMFLDKNAPARIITLLFTSPAGIFYFLAVIYAVSVFLKTVLQLVISYLVSFIYVAIMLILAPIFIPCFLFSFTKGVFDRWIQYMFRYAIEPILLIVGLSIIASLLTTTFNQIFNDALCWKCVIPLSLGFITNWLGVDLPDSLTTIYCIEFFQPWGYDNQGGGIPVASYFISKLPYILFLMIIVKFLEGYRELIDRILTTITGAQQQAIIDKNTGSGHDNLTDSISNTIVQTAKGTVGLDDDSVKRREERANGLRKSRNDPVKTPRK